MLFKKENKDKEFVLELQLFGEEENNKDEEGKEGNEDKGGGEEKTFSQKELGAIIARERKEAQDKLFRELGVEKPEDLKGIIQKHRETEEANKTFEAKFLEAEAKAEAKAQEAEAIKRESDIKIKMISNGFSEDQITDFLGIVNKADDAEAEIKRLAEKYNISKGDNKGVGNAGFAGSGGGTPPKTNKFSLR